MQHNNITETIRLQNLEFAYPKQPPLFHIPKLTVSHGEHLFIQGESGSGKSTLLSLIGGVLSPRQGQVEVLSHTMDTLSHSQKDAFRANHIGFIFQQFNLLPFLSVIENITLPCFFSEPRKRRALAKGDGLDNEARRLMSHLDLSDKLAKQSIMHLSIGQQQRVAAARAIIGHPEIIIADEPTSALDEAAKESFIKLIFNECAEAKTSLVFVSHEKQLAKLFDRTIQMDDFILSYKEACQ